MEFDFPLEKTIFKNIIHSKNIHYDYKLLIFIIEM